MAQTPFAYALAANDVPVALSLAVFADRPHVLARLRDDGTDAGFHVTAARSVASLLDGEAHALAEVVLVDCPMPDGAGLAALTRLDMRAAQAGAQLIVATTMDGLDGVFGCLDQSGAQLLVDPGEADYALALGRARVLGPSGRVRELGDADRLVLLHLTEQVGQILQQLGRISPPGGVEASVFAFAGEPARDEEHVRRIRPPLPDPQLVRRIIRQRLQRQRFFNAELFADPAWDMLLDLTAARAELKRVSVTSLCIAAAVPPTTALRWIAQMQASGLFRRVEDQADRRRAFIELTEPAADAMARYFESIEETSVLLV